MKKQFLCLTLCLISLIPLIQGYYYNGVNGAWDDYGNDFGNSPAPAILLNYQDAFQKISAANSLFSNATMRIWVHCGGGNTPIFNTSTGFVIATDRTGTFITDILNLLNTALQQRVQVYLCLWNLAVAPNPLMLGLFSDLAKLQSYFQVVLIPLLKQIAYHPALAGIDIVNEPEGSLAILSDPSRCQDTLFLTDTGAGWTNLRLLLVDVQRFVAQHAQIIRSLSPYTLGVTIGSWNMVALNDMLPKSKNIWSDECLSPLGSTLNIYQVHSYAQNGVYDQWSPFQHSYSTYFLDKPLIVGEFSSVSSGGLTSAQQYQYLYCHGYAGSWGWQFNGSGEGSDSPTTLLSGIQSLPIRC